MTRRAPRRAAPPAIADAVPEAAAEEPAAPTAPPAEDFRAIAAQLVAGASITAEAATRLAALLDVLRQRSVPPPGA